MPRNIKKAFAKGTRAEDGKPGPEYWQNYGRYHIQITALPPDRTIKGSESIIYFNQSPDTLQQIILRLWLNFHKPEAPHLSPMDPNSLNDGILIDKVKVNGIPYDIKKPGKGITTKSIRLLQPLYPEDSIRLQIDWHYEIALKSNREGRIDTTTYFIGYFYPRVSVYDDYNGWDLLDFTGSYQEFYNDFNDYTFSVTVPKNYIVWATGKLQNASEVLQPEYVNKLKKSYISDSIIHIVTANDLDKKQITIQNATNTWKWEARNVTDIAIALSDHYNWDASSVAINPGTGDRASMQAAYNDTAKDFHHMVSWGKAALSWFSKNWPGIPYPYPKMTAIQGYADMEYPMMINDASSTDPFYSRFVANHEIVHSYFPFYMGINESRYAFMDEGWATTFEFLIGRAQFGKKEEDFYKKRRISRWINDPSQEEQVPVITLSNILRGRAYIANAYEKAALGYLALKDLLGDALFKKCLQGYIGRWHGKHPIPWDFFNTFNDISGRDLNWFWDSWFFSHGYNDLTITSVKQKKNKYTINIQNTGGFPIPFDVKVINMRGDTTTRHFTPIIWKKDLQQTAVSLNIKNNIKAILLDSGIWIDAHPKDNIW